MIIYVISKSAVGCSCRVIVRRDGRGVISYRIQRDIPVACGFKRNERGGEANKSKKWANRREYVAARRLTAILKALPEQHQPARHLHRRR